MARTQWLVIGFMAFAWLTVVVLAQLAPLVYDDALRLPAGLRYPSLAVFSVLIATVVVGVTQRWRWLFWLLLIANLAGGLRAAVSVAELVGWAPLTGPAWYVAFQGLLGIVQLGIGVVMVADYRAAGAWGATVSWQP